MPKTIHTYIHRRYSKGNGSYFYRNPNSWRKQVCNYKIFFFQSPPFAMCFQNAFRFMNCQLSRLPEKWLVTNIAATTETLSTECTHIHCLVSVNIHLWLKNVNGCNFFLQEKIWCHTSVLYTLLYQLLFCQNGLLTAKFNLYCHTYNTIKWHYFRSNVCVCAYITGNNTTCWLLKVSIPVIQWFYSLLCSMNVTLQPNQRLAILTKLFFLYLNR